MPNSPRGAPRGAKFPQRILLGGSRILRPSEDLNNKASRFIRGNTSVKGQPNLTIPKFWQCPPYETPEPGFPIKILGSHRNFQNDKSRIERLLVEDKGHIEYMLPKFNCEVNPIKRVWAQEKRCSKAYCRYGVKPPAERYTPSSRFGDSRK